MTGNTDKSDNTPYLLAIAVALIAFWRYGNFGLALILGLGIVGIAYAYQVGMLADAERWLRPQLVYLWEWLKFLFTQRREQQLVLEPYEIELGKVIGTRENAYSDLQELGSFGVYAITGGGKTSFIHWIIHWLIAHNTPAELRLTIADLKEGLDFRIYRRLPHLLFPVTTTSAETERIINGLLEEMNTRGQLFKAIPPDRLCNSLDDYHRLKDQLLLNHLPNLPRILAIFDESHNITYESERALNGLTKLAKEGRAFGISVVCSTQLPNVEAIPTKLKSQFSSMFCGYLSNPSHYYKIIEVLKEVWEPFHKGGKIPGRFIANVAGEVEIVQAPWVPRRQLEDLARQWSEGREEPTWPERHQPSEELAQSWSGSVDEKRAMVIAWMKGFDEIPSADEFRVKFQTSLATYYNWVPPLWDEIKGHSN